MVPTRSLLYSLLIALMLSFAGCSDDSGGSDDGEPEPEPTMTDGPEPEPEPTTAMDIYVNGTVSGTADCQAAAQGFALLGGTPKDIPVEAINGTYEVTRTTDEPGATICLYFEDGSSGLSGTVPDTTQFIIYADLAPAPVGFSVKFTPAMA